MKKIILGAALALLAAAGSAGMPQEAARLTGDCLTAAVEAQPQSAERVAGDYNYVVRPNGTIKITKYRGTDTRVTVVKRIEGKKVTYIGAEAFAQTEVAVVTLPKTVVAIGDRAFEECEQLKKITLPEGLEQIGKEVFLGCEKLKKVTVPEQTRIGKKAFGFDADGNQLEAFELYCYEGSAAQKYAQKHDFDYTVIQAEATETPEPTETPEATPEAVETAQPEATETPQPTETPEVFVQPTETADSDVREPNHVAAGVVVVACIAAIIGCIVLVSRRRK